MNQLSNIRRSNIGKSSKAKSRATSFLSLTILLLSLPLTTNAAAASVAESSKPVVELMPNYKREMKKIYRHPKVKKALAYVETVNERAEKELVELNEIPAPPFMEQARGIRFAEMLREAGLTDVTIDEVGNVIGRREGTSGKRTIAYSGHLDTVFPAGTDVTVKYKDGKMYAPGIADNSRGLVTVLDVLRGIQHAKIKTEADILIVGNVGEEGLGDLRGVKYLFRDGAPKIDALIAIDGGDAERIVYGGVGSHRYKVTFKGPGGHSWGHFGLPNPHHALGHAISNFANSAPQVLATGSKTSYSVGRIGGGTSINSIAFESWMEVDMRSGDQSKLDEIDAVFQKAVQMALVQENKAKQRGENLQVEIERVGKRPAALGDIESSLVQRAIAATQALGIAPSLEISSTDANLPISKGIPAVTMSRGGKSGRAHALDEWWQDDNAYISVQIGILTLLAEAGLSE
mgnify:CR=1 FL=1|jgi:tripeptide aminopeptidase